LGFDPARTKSLRGVYQNPIPGTDTRFAEIIELLATGFSVSKPVVFETPLKTRFIVRKPRVS
jgi:hypothetical protein